MKHGDALRHRVLVEEAMFGLSTRLNSGLPGTPLGVPGRDAGLPGRRVCVPGRLLVFGGDVGFLLGTKTV